MRLGLAVPQLGPHATAEAFREFCTEAERLGFDSLWVQQHLFVPEAPESGYLGRSELAIPEVYRSALGATEAMAFAAALTSRVTIGSSILVAGYHRPVDLAQRLATLDVLSGGRIIAGLSIGWSRDEHRQMDVDSRTRGRRITELVEAVQACWGPDPVSYKGEFFDIPSSYVGPKPVQQPHPPLLSGMASEPGLRRTAALFDMWTPGSGSLPDIESGLAEVNAMRVGKPPIRCIVRSMFAHPVARKPPVTVEEMTAYVGRMTGSVVDEVIVDANFWPAMDAPEAWARLPHDLLPILEVAHGDG